MSEDWKNFIFIALGKVNLILLTELQEGSYQGLRCSDTSSNPLLKLFIPCYLSAQLFVILSIKVSTDQGRCPDTAANCT